MVLVDVVDLLQQVLVFYLEQLILEQRYVSFLVFALLGAEFLRKVVIHQLLRLPVLLLLLVVNFKQTLLELESTCHRSVFLLVGSAERNKPVSLDQSGFVRVLTCRLDHAIDFVFEGLVVKVLDAVVGQVGAEATGALGVLHSAGGES